MAIIPMQHLSAVVLEQERDGLLKKLMAAGCLEIIQGNPDASLRWPQLQKPDGIPGEETRIRLAAVRSALETIIRLGVTARSPLFPQPVPTTLEALDNPDDLARVYDRALTVNRLRNEMDACLAEEDRLGILLGSLGPWQKLGSPLEITATEQTFCHYGICPASVDISELEAQLEETAPETYLSVADTDLEQHYLFLIIYKSQESAVDQVLKGAGFSRISFKGIRGTPLENLTACKQQILRSQERRQGLLDEIRGMTNIKSDLEFLFDALSVKQRQEEVCSELLTSSRTVLLEGWAPKPWEAQIRKLLDSIPCAYEFRDPLESEEPPVAFQNSWLTAPFGLITSLYGTPGYRSAIDPTPFMAPFFFIFFGMMVADTAYGIIIALTALWALRQHRQQGFLRQLMVLVLYCGLSTMVWGLLFGSWFGDFVPAVSKMLTGSPVSIPPLWFDPLKQPMDMLIFSFALGGIQILTGLGLSGWRQIQAGHWKDALYDSGFWFLILIGLVLGLLQIPHGFEIAAAGASGVILTAGRAEKNPFKRLLTGLLSLYGVTGYLADVLSYSRLLALGLASGVIASVVNAMGTIGGKTPGGIVALVLIFAGGHLFNLAINLVGAYVHASRLQYVEFFSKFYVGGGKPFKPFAMDTQYLQVIGENTRDHSPE